MIASLRRQGDHIYQFCAVNSQYLCHKELENEINESVNIDNFEKSDAKIFRLIGGLDLWICFEKQFSLEGSDFLRKGPEFCPSSGIASGQEYQKFY